MMQVRAMEAAARVQARRAVPVKALLEWAFADECAQLDFAEEAGAAELRMSVDPIWRMMRQAELGCRVDGGCPTGLEVRRHDDAELIAAVVARMPVARGGRAMAVRVAELASARSVPDWMPDARPKVAPKAWRNHKHGRHALTEACGEDWYVHRGRVVHCERRCCPVVIRPTAAQIAAARRGYLEWWGALLHLQQAVGCVGLARHLVTDAMPPITPWKENA